MEVDEGMDNKVEIKYQWYYYDEEDEFNKLLDACN